MYVCMYVCMYVFVVTIAVPYPLFVDEVRLLLLGLLHFPRREERQRAVGRSDSAEVAEIRHPHDAIPSRGMYVCMYVCKNMYVL